MKQLEFRAWHKEEKRWIDIISFNILPDGSVFSIEEDNFGTRKYYYHDYYYDCYHVRDVEIIQFTGLLDKNGKKIFEGDIISYDSCLYGNQYGKKSRMIEKIKFTTVATSTDYGTVLCNCFAAQYKDGDYEYSNESLNMIYKTSEVIGNVFENPDLLNKTTPL